MLILLEKSGVKIERVCDEVLFSGAVNVGEKGVFEDIVRVLAQFQQIERVVDPMRMMRKAYRADKFAANRITKFNPPTRADFNRSAAIRGSIEKLKAIKASENEEDNEDYEEEDE